MNVSLLQQINYWVLGLHLDAMRIMKISISVTYDVIADGSLRQWIPGTFNTDAITRTVLESKQNLDSTTE